MTILKTIDLDGFGKKHSGKVRDFYVKDDKRILITTDRVSAFDAIIGYIPHKGAVLNLLSQFWFEQTRDIVQNHMIEVPDPNVIIGKNCKPIHIEMVVRGYITGVTGTSIWGSYEKGERLIYGIPFPDGLKKNQKLPAPVITPTTKADIGHDERLTRDQIIDLKLVDISLYEQMEQAALALFKRGTDICEKAGIILVDTKYEFGVYNGKLMLIDEVHTPDSSRFWIKGTYKQKLSSGEEPENFDKEFLRKWLKEQGYSGEGTPPQLSKEITKLLSQRYRDIYEKITGEAFSVDETENIEDRIKRNLEKLHLSS